MMGSVWEGMQLGMRLDKAEAERDEARAELERVREAIEALHFPVIGDHIVCLADAAGWPCPTIRALTAPGKPQETPRSAEQGKARVSGSTQEGNRG